MLFLGKLSLFLVFLSFPYSLPSSISSSWNQCSWLALGADLKDFGSNGQDGTVGENGKNGQNSDSLTIFADGSPLTLNLSGKDGTDGKNGSSAKEANCKNQPLSVDYNLQAPSGGNGANGGNGGDGGNGGGLSIYSTNPANLKQIYITAVGGKGGKPGSGGDGSKGCNCSQPFWNLESCTGNPGNPDYRCTTREFRCQDGKDGIKGGNGVPGREGLPGKLTLISLNKPLEPDQPSATVSITRLKEKGFILSKNQWETRNGAKDLFAPGSIIDDQYLALVQRVERSFLLVWNSPQPFNKFADKNITLTLAENEGINVTLPKDVWIEATTQQQNNITEFVVYNALLADEATQLEQKGLSGNGTSLQLTIVDNANQSNLIATKFKVKYRITRSDPRFRPVSDYTTKYDGEMPVDLVALSGNHFTLDLGKLPLQADDLKQGLGVEIEVIATRSFAGYSADQNIVVRDVLGPFK